MDRRIFYKSYNPEIWNVPLVRNLRTIFINSHVKTCLAALILFMLNGCVKKTVVIEYDHTRNFDDYEFSKSLDAGYGQTSTGLYTRDGFFLIFNICSIRNDDKNAETFNLDLSKFYVIHNGKKYNHTPLQAEQYRAKGMYDWVVPYPADIEWRKAFKSEVQTAPNKRKISPHLENILSVSWRFAIWIGDSEDTGSDHKYYRGKRVYNLRYDNSKSKESILFQSRGYAPAYNHSMPIDKDDLAQFCRPQL